MSMTLQTYDPQQVDQLALRLLDLAAVVRQMANRSRENGIADFALHDKKALEWCAKLEQWARKTPLRSRGANPSGQGRAPWPCRRRITFEIRPVQTRLTRIIHGPAEMLARCVIPTQSASEGNSLYCPRLRFGLVSRHE